MLMAKGKMGERVSEDAQLKLTDLVVDYGYKVPGRGLCSRSGLVREYELDRIGEWSAAVKRGKICWHVLRKAQLSSTGNLGISS